MSVLHSVVSRQMSIARLTKGVDGRRNDARIGANDVQSAACRDTTANGRLDSIRRIAWISRSCAGSRPAMRP